MKPKDILAFIGLSLAWGSSFFWVKIALDELGPFNLVALRLLVGAVALAIVALIRRLEWPKTSKHWSPLITLALINVAVPLVITAWGQQFIDSGIAAILLSTVPLFTVTFSQFFLRDDRITWMRAAGLLVGFSGVVVLLLRDVSSDAVSTFWGYASQLTGSVMYSAATVLARRTLQGVSFILQSLIPIALADALIWLFVPFVESPIQLPQTTPGITAILFLGIISSCVAYLLFYYLLHAIGPTRSNMVTYTFPLVGVLLGVTFLNESLDLPLLLGAALVVGSVFVVNRN
ncbi:MAG: DMT family transporter [Anaerolineales bacterium]